MYVGVTREGPLDEDVPLPMTASHVSPAFKKIGELLTGHLAGTTGVDVVNYRISAIWGPLGRTSSPFFAAPQLVPSVAHSTALNLPPCTQKTRSTCDFNAEARCQRASGPLVPRISPGP